MKYFILKDGRLVNTVTSRRAAIKAIREDQAREMEQYVIWADFSLIHGDVAGMGYTTTDCTEFFVIANGILQCSNIHSVIEAGNIARTYQQRPNPYGSQTDYMIIAGKPEESIAYPKRKRPNQTA